MSDQIDKFRQEIRDLLRDAEGNMGPDIATHYAKFNEDLEYKLEQTGVQSAINDRLYDLLIKTGNHGYMAGVQFGLRTGSEKVTSMNVNIEKMKKQVSEGLKRPSEIQLDQAGNLLKNVDKDLHKFIASFNIFAGLTLMALGYLIYHFTAK
jgi:hypothetical protein